MLAKRIWTPTRSPSASPCSPPPGLPTGALPDDAAPRPRPRSARPLRPAPPSAARARGWSYRPRRLLGPGRPAPLVRTARPESAATDYRSAAPRHDRIPDGERAEGAPARARVGPAARSSGKVSGGRFCRLRLLRWAFVHWAESCDKIPRVERRKSVPLPLHRRR